MLANDTFSDYFNSDFIPTDDEAIQIEHLLKQQSYRLCNIEANIKRAKALYDDLIDQRSRLLQVMKGHQRLISLPRRDAVPIDVLQEIFLHCLSDVTICKSRRESAPVLLTQVCRRWRHTALSMPRLWTSILVSVPRCRARDGPETEKASLHMEQSQFIEGPRSQAAGALEWLKRSKSRPVSVKIVDDNRIVCPHNSFLNIFKAISSSTERWRDLCLTTSPTSLASLLNLPSTTYTALECLQLTFLPNWREDGTTLSVPSKDVWSKISLLAAPSLQKLHISDLPVDAYTLPVAWSSLTHLTLDRPDEPSNVQGAIEILKKCKNLVTFQLVIKSTFRPFGFFGALPPISLQSDSEEATLPNLTKLSIKDSALSNDPTIFDSINTPSLSSVDWFWPSLPHSPLLSITQKHHLLRLSTNAQLFETDEEFLRCLYSCQGLVELVLSATEPRARGDRRQLVDATDEFLQLLSTKGAEGKILCPRLEVFERSVEGAKYTEKGILEFVKKKREGGPGLSRLRRLALVFDRPQVQSLRPELDSYLREDLEIVLDYSETCCSTTAAATKTKNIPFPAYSFRGSKIF